MGWLGSSTVRRAERSEPPVEAQSGGSLCLFLAKLDPSHPRVILVWLALGPTAQRELRPPLSLRSAIRHFSFLISGL